MIIETLERKSMDNAGRAALACGCWAACARYFGGRIACDIFPDRIRGCLFVRGDWWIILYPPCTAVLVCNKPTWVWLLTTNPSYIGVYTMYNLYTHTQLWYTAVS